MMKDSEKELIPYINKNEFPTFMVIVFLLQIERVAKTGLAGGDLKEYGGLGLSLLDSLASSLTMTKYDASIASFFGVHNHLGIRSIYALGNDEQKARMLPGCISMK